MSQIDVADKIVAPYTGAWIEIFYRLIRMREKSVAPYTGAWIEIQYRLPY